MQIEAIAFEIRDFSNGSFSEYLVENTIENQELINSHRFTRDIRFVKIFDFQFEKEETIPEFFAEDIDMSVWITILNNNPELAATVAELEEV